MSCGGESHGVGARSSRTWTADRAVHRCRLLQVLQRQGHRLVATASGRPCGDDEFVVLLPITDTQGALDVAQRILQAIHALDIAHSASPVGRVTASIGVAQVVPGPNSTPQELLERADRTLYAAKQAGRNRVMAEPAYLFDRRVAR
jgi:diguanylate cyclase (GGDEF)-like protein